MSLGKQSKDEYYDSIDTLPQWNWSKVHETSNFSYLKKLESYKDVEFENTIKQKNLWTEIYDEFLEEFELSKSFNEIRNKKLRIAKLQLNFINSLDRSILNDIDLEEYELSLITEEKGSLKMRDAITLMEEKMRRDIDIKTISVAKYHTYLKNLSKNGRGN